MIRASFPVPGNSWMQLQQMRIQRSTARRVEPKRRVVPRKVHSSLAQAYTTQGLAVLQGTTAAIQRAALGVGTIAVKSDTEYILSSNLLSAYKTADESNSTTTLQSDDHLTVNVAASTKYRFLAFMFVAAAGALEGFKCGLNGSSTVTSLKAEITLFDDVTNAMVALDRVTAYGSSVGAGLSLGTAFATIEGTVEINGAGTLLVEWAQNGGAGASATTVQRGSFLQVMTF